MKYLLIVLSLCFGTLLVAQEKFTISGYISDAGSGEKLIGASVYDKHKRRGTSANLYGFYSLTLPKDTYTLVFSYVGYQPIEQKIELNADVALDIDLSSNTTFDEVQIVGEKIENIHDNTKMGTINIPIQQIEKMPTFMGERDLIKVAQMLPGVQSAEGSSGMYVRGGGPDQNLILLDGVPVYNVNHLFGFFSVFNSDAISNVELIKGGFPARYGGRLSSVLDIRMKEGNMKKLSGTASIGLVSSKLTLEGPIIKDKTSFVVSGRRTYIDLLAKPFIRAAARSGGSNASGGYYFYDLNTKINHKFSDKSRLFLSMYTGRDKGYFWYEDEYNYMGSKSTEYANNSLGWGNITSALRWNYVINPKLFSNVTLVHSRYNFKVAALYNSTYTQPNNPEVIEEFGYEYNSGIYDWGGKLDFDFLPNPNHFIRFGMSNIYHTFTPGISTTKFKFEDNTFTEDTSIVTGAKSIYAHELGAYIEDDIRLGDKLKVNIGFHLSAFNVKNQFYVNPQPRFSANYQFLDNTSIKLGYSRMNQYIHLLTNSTVGLPTDLWVPVTDTISPMVGDQIALGIAHSINKDIEVSVEGYYKTMHNVIEYKDGVSFLLQADDWQNKVESGKGWAYGTEVFIQKKYGKTTGWIGYTLSWTNRQFENLNYGEIFPYKYDRRHDVSIAIVHDFSDKFNMGLTWEYGTGNAISLPIAQYPSAPENFNLDYNYWGYYNDIEYYESRNGYRMPSYHRLDLSANFIKQKKHGERIWNISVYNMYNRQNPFALYFSYEYSGEKVLKQISLFPIIPSFSYTYKF